MKIPLIVCSFVTTAARFVRVINRAGVKEETCGLRALVREVYGVLGLQTYFTSGETETRAWTIHKGWTAPQAAGVIHSDFERCAMKCMYRTQQSVVFHR